STDGGGTWSAVNAGLPATSVETIAIDPQTPTTLYAGTSSYGVFKSTDGGGSWTAANTGLPATYGALVIDPQTPITLYAGTSSQGLFKSTNGGGSWTAANTGLPQREGSSSFREVLSVVIDSQTPSTLYAGTTDMGVFKSTDGGGGWVNVGPITKTIFSLAIDPRTPTTLYAGTTFGDVLRSTDAGDTWTVGNHGLPSPDYSDLILALIVD